MSTRSSLYAIIVAGGTGVRMGSTTPKQFLLLGGKPVLFHAINAFFSYDNAVNIIVVLPENQITMWNDLVERYHLLVPHRVTVGGDTRFASVTRGLALIEGDGVVAIHDGVRPLIDTQTIHSCFSMAQERGTAIPAIAPIDSIRYSDTDGNKPISRDNIRLIQTPQVFRTNIIKEAYRLSYRPEFTDDASVVEASGVAITIVEGNPLNIKITTPVDLKIAESLLSR